MKKIFLALTAVAAIALTGCKDKDNEPEINVITYTANAKLKGLRVSIDVGALTFGPEVISHTFHNGEGKITCSGKITKIGKDAFYDCKDMTSITIPNSVTEIGSEAFEGCEGLTGTLVIPSSVTTIGKNAFYYCSNLTKVTIPNSVTTIGESAFCYCNVLVSVNIPNSVTKIGEYAFCHTGLQSITIPNSVTEIGSCTFYCCFHLTSVSIPNSVTKMGSWAFSGCIDLKSITCEAITPPTCGSDCFERINKSIPVYVPAHSVGAYKVADQWKNFTNIQAIPSSEL